MDIIIQETYMSNNYCKQNTQINKSYCCSYYNSSIENNNNSEITNFGYDAIGLEISGKCNFQCKYCVIGLRPDDTKIMSFDKIIKILEYIKNMGGEKLNGIFLNVYGEPMLHPNLFEIIEYMRYNGLISRLITNGSMLHNENRKKLIKNTPDFMNISIESLNSMYFNEIKGTEINYDLYINNIIELIKEIYYQPNNILKMLRLDLMYVTQFELKKISGALTNDKWINMIYHKNDTLYKDVLNFLEIIQTKIPELEIDKARLKNNIDRVIKNRFTNDDILYYINKSIIISIKEYLPLVYYDRKNIVNNDARCPSVILHKEWQKEKSR